MTAKPIADPPTPPAADLANPDLEQTLIRAYLHEKGYTPETLHGLPENDIKRLMTEASSYASMRMAEIEARARFRQELHDAYTSDNK